MDAELDVVDIGWPEHEGEEVFTLRGVVRIADAGEQLDVCGDQLLSNSCKCDGKVGDTQNTVMKSLPFHTE